ncbi:MAG: hypothetical protein IKL28_09550 [Lachnospiraceae bacterium]|nr:hypothetical protein [Lachnospiraceae bacterium]
MEYVYDLLGGIVVNANKENRYQNFLEIKLVDGNVVVLTATPNGQFRIGEKIEVRDEKSK